MFQPIRSALFIKKPLPHEVTYEVSQEIHHEPAFSTRTDHEVVSEATPTHQAVCKNDEEGAF